MHFRFHKFSKPPLSDCEQFIDVRHD